jgi:hypothetical protein
MQLRIQLAFVWGDTDRWLAGFRKTSHPWRSGSAGVWEEKKWTRAALTTSCPASFSTSEFARNVRPIRREMIRRFRRRFTCKPVAIALGFRRYLPARRAHVDFHRCKFWSNVSFRWWIGSENLCCVDPDSHDVQVAGRVPRGSTNVLCLLTVSSSIA